MKLKWVQIGDGKKAHAIPLFKLFKYENNNGFTTCGLRHINSQPCLLPKCLRCTAAIEKRRPMKRKNDVTVYSVPMRGEI